MMLGTNDSSVRNDPANFVSRIKEYMLHEGIYQADRSLSYHIKQDVAQYDRGQYSSKIRCLLVVELPIFLGDAAGTGAFTLVRFAFKDDAVPAKHLVLDVDLQCMSVG